MSRIRNTDSLDIRRWFSIPPSCFQNTQPATCQANLKASPTMDDVWICNTRFTPPPQPGLDSWLLLITEARGLSWTDFLSLWMRWRCFRRGVLFFSPKPEGQSKFYPALLLNAQCSQSSQISAECALLRTQLQTMLSIPNSKFLAGEAKKCNIFISFLRKQTNS
jgi:hypothetical protein